jgi:hypothetical protein
MFEDTTNTFNDYIAQSLETEIPCSGAQFLHIGFIAAINTGQQVSGFDAGSIPCSYQLIV